MMRHIDWTALLSHWGYWAVLVGTFLEGESILVLAAAAAHKGYLHIGYVLVAALVGSFSGDQLYFFLGRRHGRRFLLKRPKWQQSVARVHQLLHRYHAVFILGFRFLYGLRTVSPFVLGMSNVESQRFFLLNFVGALLWTVVVGGLGYAVGHFALDMFVGPWGLYALAALVATALGLAAWVTWTRR